MSGDEKQDERIFHCEICREIEEGCEIERVAGIVPKCEFCGRKGFMDRGDGTGIACNLCARGYRMKLWLRHQAGATNDAPLIATI